MARTIIVGGGINGLLLGALLAQMAMKFCCSRNIDAWALSREGHVRKASIAGETLGTDRT